MRQSLIAAALCVLVLGIVAAGIFGNSASQAVLAQIQDTVAQELGKAVGTEVSVGKIEISSYNQIALYHTLVKDKDNRVMLDSEKITVAYDPIRLLQGKTSSDVIREVVLTAPKLNLVKSASGRWNVQDLQSATEGKESAAFKGKVVIEQGEATVSMPQGQWIIGDIKGMLDFGRQPSITVNLAASHNEAGVSMRGTVSSQGNGALHIKAARVPLDEFTTLLPDGSGIHLSQGNVSMADLVLKLADGNVQYAGEANFSQVGFTVDDIPVSEASGLVTFNQDNSFHLYDVNGRIAEQQVRLDGKVEIKTAEPQFDLHIISSSFDPTALSSDFTVKGPLKLDVRLKGTSSYPLAEGQFSLEQGEVAGYALQHAKAELSLAGKKLFIKSLTGGALGGQIEGTGSVELANYGFTLRLKGSQIDSTYVAELSPYLSGRGNADLFIRQGGQGQAVMLQGTAEMDAGTLAGIAFDRLSAGFYKQENDIRLEYAVLQHNQGTITAYGSLKGDTLNLELRGQGVPLEDVNRYVNGMGLAGRADFTGHVEGTGTAPLAYLDFKAKDGQVLSQPYGKAQGHLGITPQAVSLTGVELTNGVTVHKVSGTVGLTGGKELNLAISSRRARAENLVQLLLPGEKLTGNVDNDLVLTGTLDNISATGKLLLTEGSFRGHLIAQGGGSYERRDGVTYIKDFTVQSLNAAVKLNGTIGQNNEFNLAVVAQDLDISRLHFNFPYPVIGKINFNGQLEGVPENPIFSGKLSTASLSLNGQQITDVDGQININGSQINITHFNFKENGGVFAFAGGVNTESGLLHGTMSVEEGELASILPVFNVKIGGIAGRLNGYIGIDGTTANPTVALNGSLSQGKIKNYPLDSIDMDLLLENNIVTVNHFEAKQGTGMLAVRGQADLKGALALQVGGRDIDAGLLTAWFESSFETKGKMNFAAEVSGTVDSPNANVSLEIANGGVGNATFDALYGMFILDQGSINVNQLMLKKGPYKASAYGTIPYKALNPAGRREANSSDHMNLKVRLDEANLSILPLLTNEVAWAAGPTKGEVTIGGTLAAPTLSGSILVQDGTLKLKSLADPIQKVGVDIRFEDDKIDVKAFEGYSGSGFLKLSGGASLKGLSLEDYNLALTMDRFSINNKYFKGPLNGNLALHAVNGKPTLTGKVLFENTTIDIPVLPELSSSALDIGLDVEVLAGKKVRLYNSYMYDIYTEGRVKFSGTTQQPSVSGRFDAIRGTVSYLRTQFAIQSGSASFTQFGSFEPVIALEAQTKLVDTTVHLYLNGPVRTMQMRLTSEPAMSQQEILSLLTLRSRYFDKQKAGAADTGLGRDELVGLLDAGLQMSFVSAMEGTIREALNLDEFRLVRDTLSSDGKVIIADREVYNLEIGKYVTDRLFLNYTLGLGHEEGTFGARYDLSRRFSLTGSIDERNRTKFGIEARFTF